MVADQKDVFSAYDLFLAKQAVASYGKLAAPPKSEMLQTSIGVLRGWNGQMEAAEAAPAIVELLSRELQVALLRTLLPKADKLPDVLPRPQIVETLLRERPQGWVAEQ